VQSLERMSDEEVAEVPVALQEGRVGPVASWRCQAWPKGHPRDELKFGYRFRLH
jgi:hypothetical protein